MKTKIVVTGGAGFIGSHIVDAFIERGHEVHVIDSCIAGVHKERINPAATYHEKDIRDRQVLKEIFQGAHYVFHLAALPRVEYSIQNPIETFDVNVTGSLVVLEEARAAGVKRVISASSGAVYGDQDLFPLVETMDARPKSPYALHKYFLERTAQLTSELYGMETVILRYANVYGPRFDANGAYGLVVGNFLTARAEGRPLHIAGDGTNTRDYVHVRDVARANILAMESSRVGKGEVINIATHRETSVNDLARLIGGEIERIPARIEPARAVFDISRAKELLQWEPEISLEKGIADLKEELHIT